MSHDVMVYAHTTMSLEEFAEFVHKTLGGGLSNQEDRDPDYPYYIGLDSEAISGFGAWIGRRFALPKLSVDPDGALSEDPSQFPFRLNIEAGWWGEDETSTDARVRNGWHAFNTLKATRKCSLVLTLDFVPLAEYHLPANPPEPLT